MDINYGFSILNDAPCGDVATIAATGLGRSGTTMLARILSDLGLDMGDRLSPQSCEDRDIQTLLKARDIDGFAALCRDRDAQAPIWAFKCPALRGSLLAASKEMRAPRLIISFRDIMAVAQRNALAVDADLPDALENAAKGYVTLVQRIRKSSVPVLMISYEKALQFPDRTVLAIAAFCGRDISDEMAAEIANRNIQNADPRYMLSRRNRQQTQQQSAGPSGKGTS